MSVISIYSTDAGTRNRLSELLASLARDGPELIRTELFKDFGRFLDSGRKDPRRILLLAQLGTKSVELASTLVEECPVNPVVWLSDLDFALFSYRLEVDHFGFLPGTKETLRTALKNCKSNRRPTQPSAPTESHARPSAGSPHNTVRERLRGFFGRQD